MKISGNQRIIANGENILKLTCTTNTANPVPRITWMNGQHNVSANITKLISNGDYGGKVLVENLWLMPTREMDGDVISCTASNEVIISPLPKKSVSLDLECKYYLPYLTGKEKVTLPSF